MILVSFIFKSFFKSLFYITKLGGFASSFSLVNYNHVSADPL